MEPGSRTTREQRGGMRDDNATTGGQWDNQDSQGKWEHRDDNTGGQGGDTYTTGQSGYEYGTTGGRQAGSGPGTDTQPDRYTTAGQYGGSESATSQTTGYADPTRNVTGGGRQPEDDDEYGAAGGGGGGPTGKPSMTSRLMGAADKMTGKIMGDPGKQARGQEREEGTY